MVKESDAVRGVVSLTGQMASVDEDLTGRENLILLARLYGFKGKAAKARADELLAAFGLEEAGVRVDDGGFVLVDRVSRTTARGVYAAGDCTGVLMLASVAAMQGRIAMSHALGDAVARVEAAGLEVLVLDQTRPEIDLSVVKVVVPGMRHFWARFAPGRLYDVPVALGRLAGPTAEADLNPVPIFL